MSKRKVKVTDPEVPEVLKVPAPTPVSAPVTAPEEKKTDIVDDVITTLDEAKSIGITEVDLRLPLGEIPEGTYVSRHCEVNHLSPAQAEMLRRITLGLIMKGALLRNGKPVQSGPDAIRYVIEQACIMD